ncbi:hypothetical protein SSABA_v1c02240 [Spiroplasma sabaudiense Ar-1343]|uniref:Transmembrane protein n=1 Tax=Spiroplasma sabaudiense Ar-1343 TaxID=1276257 RepID=W6A9H8_9MOLU|nr:hypothetical protein [Spiroplasma sabaudiense]AHI53636.1 hypothetical protein SSABA_v1c02240 [Spiroplasma sabaudiense Ar-1343]
MEFKIGMVVIYRNENYVLLERKVIDSDIGKSEIFFEIKNLINQKTLLVNSSELQEISIDKSRRQAQQIDNISSQPKPPLTDNPNLNRPAIIDETIANLKVVAELPTTEFIPKRLQPDKTKVDFSAEEDETLIGLNQKTATITFNKETNKVIRPIDISLDVTQEDEEILEGEKSRFIADLNSDLNNTRTISPNLLVDKKLNLEIKREDISEITDAAFYAKSFDNPNPSGTNLNSQTPSKNAYKINFSEETKSVFNQTSDSGAEILKRSKVYRSFKKMTVGLIVNFSILLGLLIFSILLRLLNFVFNAPLGIKTAEFMSNLSLSNLNPGTSFGFINLVSDIFLIVIVPTFLLLFICYFVFYVVYNMVRQYKKIAHYHYQLTKNNRALKEIRKQVEDEKKISLKLYKNLKELESKLYTPSNFEDQARNSKKTSIN